MHYNYWLKLLAHKISSSEVQIGVSHTFQYAASNRVSAVPQVFNKFLWNWTKVSWIVLNWIKKWATHTGNCGNSMRPLGGDTIKNIKLFLGNHKWQLFSNPESYFSVKI